MTMLCVPGSLNTSSTLIKLLARQSNNAQAQVVDCRAAKSQRLVMSAITIKGAQDCTQDGTSCIDQLSKAAKGWQKICTTEWTGKEAALRVREPQVYHRSRIVQYPTYVHDEQPA